MSTDKIHRNKMMENREFRSVGELTHGLVNGQQSLSNFCEEWLLADLYAESCNFTGESDNFAQVIAEYRDVVLWCMDIISASPTGRMMLKEATLEEWRIGIAELESGDFHLDMTQKLLLLCNNALEPSALARSGYFRNMMALNMIRALRDIWQEKRCEQRYGGLEEEYGPEALLMLERMRAADCDVLAILVGWELRSEGHGGIWRHLIGSEEGDMAMAFSNHLEKDPSSMFTGKALAASFHQWYACEQRISACDHDTLEYLDDIVKNSEAQNPFGSRTLGKMDVEILSCLPDRTAYLQGQGNTVLGDPRYFGLNDPINQTHFFHIMYDLEAVIVEGVPFRDADLAAKMFPE